MLESQRAGAMAFVVDSVKHDKQGITSPRKLRKTDLSNTMDLIVDYSTIFMKELTFAEYFKHTMKEVSPAVRGNEFERRSFPGVPKLDQT